MFEIYWIYTHKVGNKKMGNGPFRRIHSKDGKVFCSKKYDGYDATMAVMLTVKELQESGEHKRIVVKKIEETEDRQRKEEKIYEWNMETETADARKAEYAEYVAKRKAIKAKIAELEAELAKLDASW